jgi:hypothetical protein
MSKMSLAATRSKFDTFVAELADQKLAMLRESGFFDPPSEGPDVRLVEDAIHPYLGEQEASVPQALQSILNVAPDAATAAEYMGKTLLARKWYSVGQYLWRGQAQFRQVLGTTPDLGFRDAAGGQQLRAAICADRTGNRDRAAQLYEWASANYHLNDEDRAFYKDTKQLQVIWERMPYRAYALGCLDHWEEALAVAEECQRWVEEDRRAETSESYRAPLKILRVVRALAHHKVNPSDENRKQAAQMLAP